MSSSIKAAAIMESKNSQEMDVCSSLISKKYSPYVSAVRIATAPRLAVIMIGRGARVAPGNALVLGVPAL